MLYAGQELRSDGSQQVLRDVWLPEGKVLYDGKCEPHANNVPVIAILAAAWIVAFAGFWIWAALT
jgi:hypothetical protein